MSLIFKICNKYEWEEAVNQGFYNGSDIDVKDGYIHFSTKAQVKQTVEKHFKKQNDLILIAFNTSDLINDLKWEPARNGDLFPHYYGFINTTFAKKIYYLELGADNIHKFPENFFS